MNGKTLSLDEHYQDIAASLRIIRSEGLLNLCSIIPDGKLTGRTFSMPDEIDDAVNFAISENESGKNIYFTPNKVKRVINNKPNKKAIKSMTYAHADIDPEPNGYEASREALIDSVDDYIERYKPSLVIDSGNGLQLFWRHKQPLSLEGGEENSWENRTLICYLPKVNKFHCFCNDDNQESSTGNCVMTWDDCKLHPDVKIKEEWLKL